MAFTITVNGLVQCRDMDLSNSIDCTIDFGNYGIEIHGDFKASNNLTIIPGTSFINMYSDNKTFTGAGKTYYDLACSGSIITVNDSNTFHYIYLVVPNNKIVFESDSTQTIEDLIDVLNPEPTDVFYIESSIPEVPFILYKPIGDNIYVHQWYITDSSAVGVDFTALYGVDGGGNTGWIFRPTTYFSILTSNLTTTVVMKKDTNKSLHSDVSVTSTTFWDSLNRVYDVVLTSMINTHSSIVKLTNKTITHSIEATSNIVKSIDKTLEQSIELTNSISKNIDKTLKSTVLLTSSLSKSIDKAFTNSLYAISNISKNINKSVSTTMDVITTYIYEVIYGHIPIVYDVFISGYMSAKVTVHKEVLIRLATGLQSISSLSKSIYLNILARISVATQMVPFIDSVGILDTIKNLLGIQKEDTSFDIDIIMSINSALFNLKQLGVGPKRGLAIQDSETRWIELTGFRNDLEVVKSYVYSKVLLSFDPPQLGYMVDSIKEQIKELEWRINSYIELNATPPDGQNGSISYEVTPDTSILTSIKSSMGIVEEDECFDEALLIHINNVMFNLNQLAVGPEYGFVVRNKNTTWTELVSDRSDLESIRTYVYLKVRLVFDPPQMGYLVTSIKEQIKELEWRINSQAELDIPVDAEEDTNVYVVNQQTSILRSIKKLLGVSDIDTTFDIEIKMHTNSALNNLNQLGVGPTAGFTISNQTTTWTQLVPNRNDLHFIKTYVYLKVRLVFDPPQMGYLVDSIKKKILELEWRICNQIETTTIDTSPTIPPTPYPITVQTSILIGIKKLFDLADENTSFDTDLIIHINSVLVNLNQLGVGPTAGFFIEDRTATWNNFIPGRTDIEIIKSYIYLNVRLVFDPPQMGYLITSIEEQITEYEWRISINAEGDEFDG